MNTICNTHADNETDFGEDSSSEDASFQSICLGISVSLLKVSTLSDQLHLLPLGTRTLDLKSTKQSGEETRDKRLQIGQGAGHSPPPQRITSKTIAIISSTQDSSSSSRNQNLD